MKDSMVTSATGARGPVVDDAKPMSNANMRGEITRRATHEPWQTRLIVRFVVVDAIAAIVGIASAWLLRKSYVNENLVAFGVEFSYFAVGLAVVPVWLGALAVGGAYDRTVIGSSPVGYTRVLRVIAALFGAVCALAFIGQVPMSRAVVAFFFPITGMTDIVLRRLVRSHLHHRRAQGLDLHRLVLVGDRRSVSNLTAHLQRSTHAGYEVIGCYLPGGATDAPALDFDIPVLGSPDEFVAHLDDLDFDAVAISGSGLFQDASIRSISWKLHGTGIRLLMAPDVVEIAGPRIISRPAAGLPMLLVDEPRTTGFVMSLKGFGERLAALAGVVLLSPVLAAIAIIVKCTSSGPVLFRQTRIARDGHEFAMLKFRSMVENAEDLRGELLPENESDGLLFKIRDDPRVTPVGRFLRRYSLDELPQLFNVILGNMAIVGPRPPLPDEVARYQGDTGRRLMVKPGITGLWQVSGRSELSWEDTVRLDLYYVENWSLALDLIIVAKTLRAVFEGRGAY